MERRYPFLEGFGYIVSIWSVILLAIAAWLSAEGRPVLRGVVIAGSALSVVGMLLRWYVWWSRHGRGKHRK
ncbi:MAG: hypothetical protein J7494_13865 [Sphingobium sp.]|nr:hypothetical protein [Sphingobium sp.]